MKHRHLLLLVLGVCLTVTAQVFSQEQDNLDYRSGYGLVLDQNWGEVQNYFTEFQSNWPESAWADDAAFWNCYAIEQAGTQDDQHFMCYREFIGSWPDSTWVADARTKLAVLGSRLASRGLSEYLLRITDDFDFDADVDSDSNSRTHSYPYSYSDLARTYSDDLARTVEELMDRAEEALERARSSQLVYQLPDLPDLSTLSELSSLSGIGQQANLRELRNNVRQLQRNLNRSRYGARSPSRSSADNELLTVMAALRDNERASEILIERLNRSDSPDLRRRIVLLLEDLTGENVTAALVAVINNDESDDVRNDAILVLLDRNTEDSRDLLLRIAADPDYPVSVRGEILDAMVDWDHDLAVETLSAVLRDDADIALVAEAADSLSDIGSEAALSALMDAHRRIDNLAIRHEILEEIADVDS
ncbi:MAG: HEAT repeat domain-containing protein, partial [Proteobacteria bacterium]|nr:HEAT repeat domain-containing protein [Pseudomonadota bacterium]